MSEQWPPPLNELNELRKRIQENPHKKNQILSEWVMENPEEFAYRFLLYTIATERGEMAINIINSNVANLNLGEQLGHIEAVAQTIGADQTEHNQKFAEALRTLTDAIKNQKQLTESDKKEAAQVLSEIADQAKAEPQTRSSGRIKALLAGFPTMIAAAADLTELWHAWSPAIRAYFGF